MEINAGNDLQRVDPNLLNVEQLLQFRRYKFFWEKALMCPCESTTGRRDAIDCDLCHGKKFLYVDGQKISGVMVSVGASKAFKDVAVPGDWIIGKSMLTVSACYPVTFRDKLTNIDSIMRYNDLVIRGKGVDIKDTLRYPVIDTIIVRDISRSYTKGTDFSIDDAGAIIWDGTSKPEDDASYTVLYTCHPVWIALDAAHEFRDTYIENAKNSNALVGNVEEFFRKFPRQLLCSLEFLTNADAGQGANTDG